MRYDTLTRLRVEALVAWRTSHYYGQINTAPRKKCPKCVEEWENNGSDIDKIPPFFPIDYREVCSEHKMLLPDPAPVG